MVTSLVWSERYDLLFGGSLDGFIIVWRGPVLFYKCTYMSRPAGKFPTPVYALHYYSDEASVWLLAGLDGFVCAFKMSPTLQQQLNEESHEPVFTLRSDSPIKMHSDRVN
jgi:hypothetical protein